MRGIWVTITMLGCIGLGIPVMNRMDRFFNETFGNGNASKTRRTRRSGK